MMSLPLRTLPVKKERKLDRYIRDGVPQHSRGFHREMPTAFKEEAASVSRPISTK